MAATDNGDDDDKVILKLREAEDYDGGFFFCPSEVRDPPPTFRSLGCPLGRLGGRQVVTVSTSLGTYGMGSYGAFGLGLVLMPDLAACPTYQAKVGAVVKYIEGCADRERMMMEYLASASEQPEDTSNADDDDDEDNDDDDDGDDADEDDDGGGAHEQANTEEHTKQELIEEVQSKVEAKAEEKREEEEEEVKGEGEEEKVDSVPTVRDEAKWQESEWEHEWFAFLACRAGDYLQLQGKPFDKIRCSQFLFLEAVIADAQLTDRTCRFEMKRWRLEDHYTPIYEAMAKQNMVAPGSYAPEPGTNGPHPLYALVIDFLRQRPELLLDPTEAASPVPEARSGDDGLGGGGDHHMVVAKPRLPESVLHDLMAKPLGCVARVLELPEDPADAVKRWDTEESLLDAWVFTRHVLCG